ncbi:DUF2811 domain-containing protein [Phormidesmis sp. 146-35]|jgi:hypothetical protein
MDTNVSILVEIPETLHQSFLSYLEARPDWDQDRVFSAALSLFLLQNRTTNDRQTARVYLDSLFKRPLEQV